MWRQGKFHLTPPHLTSFPSGNPRLSRWLDLAPYEKVGVSYTVQTKRGCRMQCIYCTYNTVLEGHHLRLRKPTDVVDEIEEAFYQFRPESFEFVDSVFNDPMDHCQAILEEIIRRPWKARFSTMGVSPKNLDVKFLQLMKRAGFTSFMISPESASETMLTNYRKGFRLGDLRRAAEAINQFAFPVLWYFLVGGPGETSQTLQETLDFIGRYLVRPLSVPHNLANLFLGVRSIPAPSSGKSPWRRASFTTTAIRSGRCGICPGNLTWIGRCVSCTRLPTAGPKLLSVIWKSIFPSRRYSASWRKSSPSPSPTGNICS